MPDYPNPALRSVLVRTLGPLVPVWLFGLVLAFSLHQLGLVGGSLPVANIDVFLAIDSLLVIALMALLAFYQYRSTPGTVRVDVDGVTGWVARRGGEREGAGQRLAFPYANVLAVVRGGLFGYRVEARPPSSGAVDWLNLTADNAERVGAAWQAWRERERSPSGEADG
ncbi:MAG TPA: hypothetical protein VIZ68_03485 [Thermoplasmata archaeon]